MHRRPYLSRRADGPALVAVLGTLLAGCSGSSGVAAAPRAADPACTTLLAALPGAVADQKRVADPAAGAAAWGAPQIVLRCGLEPSGPSTVPCFEVNGIDWLFEDAGGEFRLTTYGRNPAVQVTVPTRYGRDLANAAMVDLGPAVAPLPVERRCS